MNFLCRLKVLALVSKQIMTKQRNQMMSLMSSSVLPPNRPPVKNSKQNDQHVKLHSPHSERQKKNKSEKKNLNERNVAKSTREKKKKNAKKKSVKSVNAKSSDRIKNAKRSESPS